MKQVKLWLLMLSLTAGLAGACAFAEYMPVNQHPEPITQMAWWGALYPEYSLPGAMETVEEQEHTVVKIRFKYLTFLNDRGEYHE